jgi:hypothetical protein
VADLALFTSPSRGLDGAAIYRMALADVGQPGPRLPIRSESFSNPYRPRGGSESRGT